MLRNIKISLFLLTRSMSFFRFSSLSSAYNSSHSRLWLRSLSSTFHRGISIRKAFDLMRIHLQDFILYIFVSTRSFFFLSSHLLITSCNCGISGWHWNNRCNQLWYKWHGYVGNFILWANEMNGKPLSLNMKLKTLNLN